MKRKITLLLALLLCAALLTGCAATPLTGGISAFFDDIFNKEKTENEIPRFDEMPYERPERALEDFAQNLVKLEELLSRKRLLSMITDVLDDCYRDYYTFDTMYTLAEIRCCQDLSDPYYAEEYAWCDDAYNELQQLIEKMYSLCGSSSRAKELEEHYFWPGFAAEYAEGESSGYSEETLELLHRESALMAEYRGLIAAPIITLDDGTEVELYSYLNEAAGEDYTEAAMAYYRQYNGEMARIYIALVRTRTALAKSLGYESCEQMAYTRNFERDYTSEDAARYLAEIREKIVPLYEQLEDYALEYPWLDEEDLLYVLEYATEEMGGEVEEAFAYILRYRLYDVALRTNKASKSFQTYLEDYESPFIFVDPYEDDEDILSLAHEFGHALDAYHNYNASESLDLSEFFSQAMEYLVLEYAEGVLPEKRLQNLRAIKWLDTLQLYVEQAAYAAFEEAVYAADPETLNAETLQALSLRCAKDYGLCDGENEEYLALSWFDVPHFFEQPFYVISYPVSNDLALQIWELEQGEKGAGLAKYLEALPRRYYAILDTAEAVGLESPFAPGRIARLAEDLKAVFSA